MVKSMRHFRKAGRSLPYAYAWARADVSGDRTLMTAALMMLGSVAWGSEPLPAPVAHWPLAVDARDVGPLGWHGDARGVRFGVSPEGGPRSSAAFDGREAMIALPAPPAAMAGKSDFAISLWLHTEASLRDALGDVVSAFETERQHGWVLSLGHRPAAVGSQGNFRQLEWGGVTRSEPGTWQDWGRVGRAVYVMALVVHEGQLYAGTCEPSVDERGGVYRWQTEVGWVPCGAPSGANAVSALASFQGSLYAGTACYRLRGSALTESPNQTPGGEIYCLNEDARWALTGRLAGAEAVASLVEYDGQLYASSIYSSAVARYSGRGTWEDCGTPEGRRVEAMIPYNGSLFGGAYDAGEVYRYTPEEDWRTVGRLPGVNQTYGFAVWQGRLFVGTWPEARVFRYEADDRWTDCGRLGAEQEVMGMAAYQGALYAGTLPRAEVYRYRPPAAWELMGRIDLTPEVKYRRVWAMAVYDGRLMAGTLPSGHVWSWEQGRLATSGRALAAGWRQVVAQRREGRWEVYVDGARVAESRTEEAGDVDLGGALSWKLGAGPNDFFNGRLADVRVYGRGLTQTEVGALYRKAGAALENGVR